MPRAIAALAMTAALAAVPAYDAAAEEGRSVASHIQGAGETVRPVAVIEREDIAFSGMRTVSDLLLSRLTYNSFGLHRPLVLGTGRAAVFINGRRISDTTLDLATLPTSAVERVEIFNGAASALHGGHAIAGAINIVLRRGYEGAEVSVFAGRPTDTGGVYEQGSALWGGAVGDGHLTIGVDVFQREEIPDAAREHSRAKWTPGGLFADASGVSIGGNTVFIATKSYDENGDVIATHVPGVDARSIGRPLGDCPGNIYTGELGKPRDVEGTGCGFPYADVSWNRARYERESLFLSFDQPLDDATDAYFDYRLATDETLERFAPSVGTFSVPSATLEAHLLPDPQIDSLPETVLVAHRFIGHGNREWRTTLDEHDLTLGVEGRLADDLGYDAHLRYYRYDSTVDGNTFISETAARDVIRGGGYDLANPLSPSNRKAIRETSLRLTRDRATEHRTVRASLHGSMFALDGGEARWAAGTEVAAEDWKDVHAYRDRNGQSYDAADVLGAGGVQAEGERRRWSGFAEALLPVRHNWDVALAGRHEGHDDVGTTFSHQVASSIRVHDAVTLRGSWDRGSSPPSLYQLHLRSSNDFPWVCDRTTHTGPLSACPVEQVVRVSSGNPALEPDDAESFSVGAVTGMGPVSMSVDWFQIALSNVPSQLSAQSIMDLEAEGALPPGVAVRRDSRGLIDQIESPLVNSRETDLSGIDVRARIGWDAELADMVFDVRWLHVSRNETHVAGERQPGDFPRNRVHGSLRANWGDVTASWNVHAVSSFWNARRTGQFDGWVGHDITLRWSNPLGLIGTDLTGGILNVTDRGPSIDPTDPDAVFATQDSIRGRTFFLNATMAW